MELLSYTIDSVVDYVSNVGAAVFTVDNIEDYAEILEHWVEYAYQQCSDTCSNVFSNLSSRVHSNANKLKQLYIGSPYDITLAACRSGNLNLVRDSYCWDGQCFITAAEYGHVDIVKYLLEVESSMFSPKFKQSVRPGALYAACVNGHVELVEYLLFNKVEVHHCLILRLCRDGNEQMFDLVIDHYSKHVDYYGLQTQTTPLYMACLYGHISLVNKLIARGADINKSCRPSDKTPLHAAVYGLTHGTSTPENNKAVLDRLYELNVEVQPDTYGCLPSPTWELPALSDYTVLC